MPVPPRRPPLSYHTLGAALMKALRFAASVLIIAAILALYRTLLPVNNTTVALTLLLAILGMSAGWGWAKPRWRRWSRWSDSITGFCRRWEP